MKKIILYSMVCLSSLLIVNTAKADWIIDINLDHCSKYGLSNGFYTNYSDCRWFYICYDGVTEAHQCLDGLIYDSSTWTCGWPFTATNFAVNCPYMRMQDY